MEPRNHDPAHHPLHPELTEAKDTLAEALAEACEADVHQLDTGELIRIEELLSIAGDAAKRAVSLKRRLRDDRAAAPADAAPTATHRQFESADGRVWDAFAVYPTQDVAARARLPEPYRSGWLAFDADGEKRRLSPIPPEWEQRSDDELRALLERADAAASRATPADRHPPPP